MTVEFYSKSLNRQVTFNAIVPVGKFNLPGMPPQVGNKPFKTMYLLHGIFGNHNSWAIGSRIVPWALERNLAVIMPAGDNSFYVDHEKSGAMYGQYFGQELVDVTREMFPLSHKREDTIVAGLSMGGYGALRTGLKYSDTFGHIAALSGALILDRVFESTDDTPTVIGRRGYYESVFGDFDTLMGSDKDPKALIKSLKTAGKPIPQLYIACGTEDILIDANRNYHQFLQENGVNHTYVEGPGGHTWDYWDEYILKVMDWLKLEKPPAPAW